jgi:glycosyltransferase involved in cell wall biosynthesis
MKNLRICLVNFSSRPERLSATLPRRIRLFGQICGRVYLLIDKMPNIKIPDGNVDIVEIKKTLPNINDMTHPRWLSTLIWLLKCIAILARMSLSMLKISREVDVVIFYAGLPFFLPLILISKFLGKKVIVMTGGSGPRSFAADHPRARTSFRIFQMLERVCYHLSDNIGVETESAIHFMGLDRFRNKTISGASIYINTNSFKIKRDLKARVNFVGYIGNLVNGKGVMNFVAATRIIQRQRADVKFLIGGDGPLFSRIKDVLENDAFPSSGELVGWIRHDYIPDYLNKLKLFVLPSYSEGLPVIILEAMACGTPVIATPVGCVPDVIKDGETGFILEDNSPECIALCILRVLEHPYLDIIINNAQKVIEQNYTFEAMVENYSKLLRQVLSGRGTT